MDTLAAVLRTATTGLKGSDSPTLDAELLLCAVLGKDRGYLRSHPEATLDAIQAARYAELTAARARGEPIAYLTGKREFWSMELKITPATLIPRPETELLVEQALDLIPPTADWEILDLGTGSGAIALALAKERPRCRIQATDFSAEALAVAADNAKQLGLSNIAFLQGDWYTPVSGRHFSLVVSNPPYIGLSDPHLTQGDLRFEPSQALASGADGLDDIRRIVAGAPVHLQDGGTLMLEHGFEQGAQVRGLLQAAGLVLTRSVRDFSGHERISMGDWANPRATR
ncbi:MAG TPA: peptide chain release factor N(5)-glutamine methyltransferase [Gammaproteobacteria bacterium]|jgi:release factor glutamine methyltransferase